MEQKKPFLLERGLTWLCVQAKESQLPLLASLIFGCLAYGFTFSNKLINHDEVHALFSKGATFSSGRWGLEIMERFFPPVSMPWIYGLLCILLAAIAGCIICRIFHVRSRLLQVLLAGSIVVFPSMTGTLTYMFTSASYIAAFLAAAIAVLLLKKPSALSAFFALGFMVLSLSCYQPYIALAAGLLVIILIQELMEGREVSATVKKGVFYLVFLGLSLVLYYISTQFINKLIGQTFNAYAGANMSLNLADIPSKIAIAYASFFRFFTESTYGLITTALSRKMHTLILGAISVFFLLWAMTRGKKDLGRMALLAALAAALPLAINCIYLFSAEEAVHTLMVYGFVSFYVLAAVLAEICLPLLPRSSVCKLLRQLSVEGTALAMALILAVNIYCANTVALNQFLRYENAYAFYTALAADIQMQPGFNENTKLALAGNHRSPEFYKEYFSDVDRILGASGFFLGDYSKDRFVQYYLGFPIPFASSEEILAVQSTPEYAEMPAYPYYGSIRMIGDILVVKLS